MKYKNIKTGAVIDSPSKIIGKAWKEHNSKEVVKEEHIEEEIDLENMTKEQLLAFAKEHGVDVNEKDTNPVIIETIAKEFE